MSCPSLNADTDRCPTQSEVLQRLLALLPRGRAYNNHDGGPQASGPNATTLGRFWSALALVISALEARICALREEFFCATHTETHDLWLAEYGLPDACDPFPDLCAKVSALGGSRCEYFAAVALRAGWVIGCTDDDQCTTYLGATLALAGRAFTGYGPRWATLFITVYLSQSPAYVAPTTTPPLAGRLLAGMPLACTTPDISPLKCLIERIVPAHCVVTYTFA